MKIIPPTKHFRISHLEEDLGTVVFKDHELIALTVPPAQRRLILAMWNRVKTEGVTVMGDTSSKKPIPVRSGLRISEFWKELTRHGYNLTPTDL